MSDLDGLLQSLPAPRWTRKRLKDMLIDCYGASARGGVDVEAVADHAGVSASTVRRWLSGQGSSRRKPDIPARRLTGLQTGTQLVEARAGQQFRYALNALETVRAQSGIVPAWRTQGWLHPHTVVIVAIHHKPWHQIVVTNGSPRAMGELVRRADIIDTIVVPTRFHAQILAHIVMMQLGAWRVHPSALQLTHGRTQVWMADAPTVALNELFKRAEKIRRS